MISSSKYLIDSYNFSDLAIRISHGLFNFISELYQFYEFYYIDCYTLELSNAISDL